MAKTYQTIDEFIGYVTKPDRTNTDDRTLVTGSQNVLINDQDKIETRKGYTRLGAENTSLNPMESSFDWNTSGYQGSGQVWNLRSYDDELEVYLGTVDGVTVDAWTRVADSWSAVDFVFAPTYDSTEGIDILVFVNGDSNLYDWSGGVTTIASATANTITKNGTQTWGQSRFLTTGTRKVLINGTEYTYTGGESTTTLTGVSPNPSGEAADSVATQTVRTNSNKPASGFSNDTIAVLNNQLWVGSNTERLVYVSTDSDFTSFTVSSPRVPGEGALLTLDNPTNAFAVFGERMSVHSGRSDIYVSEFFELDVGGTLTETLKIKKLKTSSNQAAQSQAMVAEMGDSVAFITHEPALRILENVENIADPQIRTYSNPIKPDFDNETFTNTHMLRDGNRLYIATPTNSKLYILEFREDANGQLRRFWQPPQILPIRRLSIIDSLIHGHSNAVPETYKLFNGTNDLDLPFNAIAKLAYRNFEDRANYKNFNELYVEGYISSNTTITATINYDFDGFTQSIEKEIEGTDSGTIFEPVDDESLGQFGLGEVSLGGTHESSVEQLPKFRRIIVVPRANFFEVQVVFETNSTDYRWQILSVGPNARLAQANAIRIRK